MKKIYISDVNPGMVIAEDISRNSTILLSEGNVLTAKDIDRLKKYGVKEVFVYDEEDFTMENKINIQFPELPPVVPNKKYKKWSDQFEKVIDITKLDQSDEQLNQISEDIYKSFLEKEDVVLNLFHNIGSEALSAHSINTAIISSIISVNLNMPFVFTNQLLKASLLHDIGYSLIGERVIFDYGHIDDKIVKSHVISGYNALKNMKDKISKEVIDAVFNHHERFDGTGILMKKKGDQINPLVRILQIGDAYDALIESGQTPYEAISYLLKQSGKMFDPYYVSTLFSITGLYPTGTQVLLNNGDVATVVKKGKASVFPIVNVDGEIVETGSNSGIYIKEVIKS
jgi:HD-GYP domain-containing protein (c-di-GMP phosphodiesterase class II)